MRVNVESMTVRRVMDELTGIFEYNVVLERCDQERNRFNVWTTFTLRVQDSSGPGARRTANGRRSTNACWHAVYAVLFSLYERYPAMKVRTPLYSADGAHDWRNHALDSRGTNVGSQVQPAYLVNLCDCEERFDQDEFSDAHAETIGVVA